MTQDIPTHTETRLKGLSPNQRKRLAALLREARVTRDVHKEFEGNLNFGQKLADKIASLGGSWTFIICFSSALLGWCLLNTAILARQAFDPYPYVFLNLLLSTLAALQAPLIMMSQNRQAAKDRAVTQHDYEVNLKAELEIMSLHEKMDDLRMKKFTELMQVQQQQITMLSAMLKTKS
jgi:uncharacterized membrane protein